MLRIQQYNPKANYYCNMDNLELMSDAPFIDDCIGNSTYNPDAVVSWVWICTLNGGEK